MVKKPNWNVWVRISTRTASTNREFAVSGTYSEIEDLKERLANREHVISFEIREDKGDTDVNDFLEDLGQWIEDES